MSGVDQNLLILRVLRGGSEPVDLEGPKSLELLADADGVEHRCDRLEDVGESEEKPGREGRPLGDRGVSHGYTSAIEHLPEVLRLVVGDEVKLWLGIRSY